MNKILANIMATIVQRSCKFMLSVTLWVYPFFVYFKTEYWPTFAVKNAAKWRRQHAGKKYREYAQRRVCFVNEPVPWPHSNLNVKFCTSHLCMKMSSFLFVCAWAMPRILYLSCGVPFPFWTHDNISGLKSVVLWLLRWEVIKKNSGNILFSGGQIIFLRSSSF